MANFIQTQKQNYINSIEIIIKASNIKKKNHYILFNKKKFIILLINFQIFQMNFLNMLGFGTTEKKKKGKRKNDNKNL